METHVKSEKDRKRCHSESKVKFAKWHDSEPSIIGGTNSGHYLICEWKTRWSISFFFLSHLENHAFHL